eukprot:gene7227-9858_t
MELCRFFHIIFIFLISIINSFKLIIPNNKSNAKFSVSKLLSTADFDIDVAVVGGGPAGSTIAWLLQEQEQCRVAIIDPNADKASTWYPNYGEWRDEWHVLSERMKLPELKQCTTTEWEYTDCFFGGSEGIPMNDRTTLPRAYARVDRVKLQQLMRDRFKQNGGLAINSAVNAKLISNNIFDEGIVHNANGSIIRLQNGKLLKCKTIIDASGFETRLVAKENPFIARGNSKVIPTGYQIAYGFVSDVDSLGPYDFNSMTLFDYRTSFLEDNAEWLKDGLDRPTFMYVMPLGKNEDGTYRVFWEETSLVGKGSRMLSFEECKKRAYKRLDHYGIKVLRVEEEEYCYIPMGGELPDSSQRIVAFGAAANMVHPATGYQACRMMAASTDLSKIIGDGIRTNKAPDLISAEAYRAMWGKKNRGQRDFQTYGGDFLMAQKVEILRGFFSAFFSIDQDVWSGFLAGWPGLPGNIHHETWDNRLKFALSMFLKMPNSTRLSMMMYAIQYTLEFGPNTLLRSLLPEFINGASAPVDPDWTAPPETIGVTSVKDEARKMMKLFKENSIQSEVLNETKLTEDNNEEVLVSVTENRSSYPAPFNF